MKIITEAGLISCDHATGIVTKLASQRFVSINSALVLVGNDPGNKPIAGCSNIAPTIKPCTMTMAVEEGKSALVFINNKPVCLETVIGGTDGTPPGLTKYRVRVPGQIFVDTES